MAIITQTITPDQIIKINSALQPNVIANSFSIVSSNTVTSSNLQSALYELSDKIKVLDNMTAEMDLENIRGMFANNSGGYWDPKPENVFELENGTIPSRVNGVVGFLRNSVSSQPNAIQATSGNKPYLRQTPVSKKYWLDGNTTTAALTFSSDRPKGGMIYAEIPFIAVNLDTVFHKFK